MTPAYLGLAELTAGVTAGVARNSKVYRLRTDSRNRPRSSLSNSSERDEVILTDSRRRGLIRRLLRSFCDERTSGPGAIVRVP